jgi:hypothetical protein
MQTDTIIPTLAEIQTTANSLDLPTAPITGPKLAQQLQAAADKFNAAIAAGEKTTGSGPVDVVYDQLASILIGKSSLITLPLEPIKNAHSNMATALETLVPGSTTPKAEQVTAAYSVPQ